MLVGKQYQIIAMIDFSYDLHSVSNAEKANGSKARQCTPISKGLIPSLLREAYKALEQQNPFSK